MAVEHSDEHRDDAFDDDCVAVGGELDVAVDEFGIEPYARLAPFDQVLRRFQLFVDRGQGVAHVDDYGIAVHPVVETFKFFNQYVLFVVDSHRC